MVLQGLGIQTSTSSRYFFTGSTTTFIPTTQIQDIVIHEAFKGLEVRFYLAVIVEGATEVVVVFPVRTTPFEPTEIAALLTRFCPLQDSASAARYTRGSVERCEEMFIFGHTMR